MRFLALVIPIILLSGCLTVKTDVEAYSTISDSAEVGRIYIAPFDRKFANSLQWRSNAAVLGTVLEEKGYVVTDNRSEADTIALAGFLVDDGESVTSSYSVPQWGVTGYSGATTTGSVYGNYYTANTTLNPTYGITGYSSGTTTSTIYTRGLALDFIKAKGGQKVFEAISISRGSCSSFAGVARPIIEATLSNFPEGKVGSVDIQVEGAC